MIKTNLAGWLNEPLDCMANCGVNSDEAVGKICDECRANYEYKKAEAEFNRKAEELGVTPRELAEMDSPERFEPIIWGGNND
jgi:hypothetical protein